MKKSILKIGIILGLLLANCLPVTATIENDKNSSKGVTPIYPLDHNIHININKCWVYDCQDEHNPGEFYFLILVFPACKFIKTEVYEVEDTHPQSSHNFGRLASITTQFTPQYIFIFAFEEDKKEDLNPDDYLGSISIHFAPPKGDYTSAKPYSLPLVRWDAKPTFEADISISFYHQ